MAPIKRSVSDKDLFRLACYTQVEGNFRVFNGSYRFTYYLQQISDMKQLVGKVLDVAVDGMVNRTYIQFYSKELYDTFVGMGFYKFGTSNWNVPRSYDRSDIFKKEYLRALVDSLGNVDIDRTVPYVRIHSVNAQGLQEIQGIYGGKYYTSNNNNYLQWKGNDAISICAYLNWEFYCHRNQRGAEIIKNVNWEKFLW